MAARDAFEEAGSIESVVLFVDAESKILICKDHVFQPHVRAAVSRIKGQNADRIIREEHVGMEVIAKRRAEGAGMASDGERSSTEMQREVTDLFLQAVELKASDIHIRVMKSICEVWFRINNDLSRVRQAPAAWGKAVCQTIYHSMADVADATFEEGGRQDARIGDKSKLADGLDGIRVATIPAVDGYIMVMRLLYDASGASTDLCDLGFSKTQASRVTYLKRRPTGITLITGPTGSGKSTTLQRILTSLIRETEGKKHVITVEDPPEYQIAGAVQSPVTNADTEESRSLEFQRAIKAAMRVDPDVMMIGEIRDTPSARLAFQSAMTGHQVWSTLHSNGAFQSIDRLVDLGVPLALMTDPSILAGLVSQRLLKTLCSCKRPFKDAFAKYREIRTDFMEAHERISSILGDSANGVFVTGDGCEKCRHTGISGRTVVSEVVVTDHQMMDLIHKGQTHEAMEYWKREHDGMSMLAHAVLKVKEGLVDPFATEDIVGHMDGGKSIFTFKQRLAVVHAN